MIVQTVKEYNRKVKSDNNFFKATFKTIYGKDRKTGYVASYKDSHLWAKTKTQAIKRLKERYKNV